MSDSPTMERPSDNRGPQMLGVTASFLVLMWVTVMARCYVRIKIIKAFAMDDWLALATLILMTGYGALVLAAVKEGCGQHESNLSIKQKVKIMRVTLPPCCACRAPS